MELGIVIWNIKMAVISVLQTFKASDPFFEDGDVFCALNTKEADLSELDRNVAESSEVDSVENVCQYCLKLFPNTKLLEVHILETHDELFRLMSAKKSMYECVVEGCGEMFSNPTTRKDHLVSKHSFPSSYRFVEMPHKPPSIGSGSGTHSSQKVGNGDRTHSSHEKSGSEDGTYSCQEKMEDSEQTCIERNEHSVSVPISISFGRGMGRGRRMFPRSHNKQSSQGSRSKGQKGKEKASIAHSDSTSSQSDSHVVLQPDSNVLTQSNFHVGLQFNSHVVPPSDSHVVPPSDSHVVPPSDSHVVSPSDSHVVSPSDSHIVLSPSEHDMEI